MLSESYLFALEKNKSETECSANTVPENTNVTFLF